MAGGWGMVATDKAKGRRALGGDITNRYELCAIIKGNNGETSTSS